MELRGSLGGSVRLFLQRDAVDGVEIGSERRHLASTGAIVAPLVARQGLEICGLHDPRRSGSHLDLLPYFADHVMKTMVHRQRRRTEPGWYRIRRSDRDPRTPMPPPGRHSRFGEE
jgi:hypothetical protein